MTCQLSFVEYTISAVDCFIKEQKASMGYLEIPCSVTHENTVMLAVTLKEIHFRISVLGLKRVGYQY